MDGVRALVKGLEGVGLLSLLCYVRTQGLSPFALQFFPPCEGTAFLFLDAAAKCHLGSRKCRPHKH